jgi:hypothetical protein
MWAVMALILLLFVLSVYGAFIGPQRARDFFNSIPLVIYWIAFILLLAIGIIAFRPLLTVPALLLTHTGCLLVLLGAIWSSEGGHKLQKELFGLDKIPSGFMQIYEGNSDNRVVLEDNAVKELPFSIGLKDFRIEYYKQGYLYVQTPQGDIRRFTAQTGAEYWLGDRLGTMTIVRLFDNFKITIDGDKRTVTDEPGIESNPAVEVQLTSPDGKVSTRYVFERFPTPAGADDKFRMAYERVISDYISRIQVIQNDKVVAEKDVEVNHPLHFGGYHFYQHSYDTKAGQYTILLVTSDTGLSVVYTGYFVLCAGVCWRFWLRKIPSRLSVSS